MNIKTIDKNQIGGAVIVIEEGGKRIMFDYGTELPGCTPKEEWDFTEKPVDAVFISHIHEDHIGKIYNIPKDTPIYMGEFTYKIIIRTLKSLVGLYKYHINDQKAKEEAKKKLDYLESKYKNDKIIFQSNGHKIVVEPFTVTPYMVDHSSYDAYMFLVETDKEKLVFTGDFRNVGYDYDIFKTIEKLLLTPIDYLIIEGTNIVDESNKEKTDKDKKQSPNLCLMKQNLADLFKERKHIFLVVASTNIQALKTFTHAAKEAGIKTFVTKKQHTIFKLYGSMVGKRVVDIFGDVKDIEEDIKARSLHSEHYNCDYSQEFLMKRHGFLTIIKPGTSQINIKDFKEEQPIVIYSMWKGYLNRDNKDTCIEAYADFIDECDKLGFDVYYDFHLSGHATPDVIAKVINEINPQKAIYPVHTNYKEGFLALPLSEELKSKIKISRKVLLPNYTEKDIRTEMYNIFKQSSNINLIQMFYQKQYVISPNNTNDSKKVRYSKIVADELCKDSFKKLNQFYRIPTITRKDSYKSSEHTSSALKASIPEKAICKAMYGQNFKYIGKIIDFETPISRYNDDGFAGFDLLSQNDETEEIFLLEVKKPDSPETFLRCVLEVMTYYFTIDHTLLKHDFGISQDYTIIPATLIFNYSKPYQDMEDTSQSNLRNLIKKFHDDFGFRMFYFDIDEEIKDIGTKIDSYKITNKEGEKEFDMKSLANFFKCDVDIEEFHF